MTSENFRSTSYGGWLLVAASMFGLASALYYYMAPMTGVAYSPGAALVLVSTALLFAGALVMLLDHDKPLWLLGFLYVAMFLDILGTGLAAYFLDANWLLGAMVAALIGWCIRAFFDPSDEQIANEAIRREVLS